MTDSLKQLTKLEVSEGGKLDLWCFTLPEGDPLYPGIVVDELSVLCFQRKLGLFARQDESF